MEYNFCVYIEKQMRVDMYLSTIFEDFSRSYIQAIIDSGQVSINSKIVSKNIKIKNKDEIYIKVVIGYTELEPEKIDLDVVYEDENILVINKESGLNVHPVPGAWGTSGTLVNAILYHCKDRLPCIKWTYRPWIVHRLDKDTSGVIMVAKKDEMMNYLANIIKNRHIEKYYIAIVFGRVENKKFKIESYIWRDPNNRKKMTAENPLNPKLAISYGEVLDYIDDKYTLLKMKIETGRTHQIRVHLASIWYPIIWDKVYGNTKVNREVELKYELHRQALHAYELELELYWKKIEFKAELKDDMKKIIWEAELNNIL